MAKKRASKLPKPEREAIREFCEAAEQAMIHARGLRICYERIKRILGASKLPEIQRIADEMRWTQPRKKGEDHG